MTPSRKARHFFNFSPSEPVTRTLFIWGQRNSFEKSLKIFAKGNRLLCCAAVARKRPHSFCSTSGQPHPSCAFFSRMSVRPSVRHALCRHSPARCAHLCRLDLLPEERGGSEGWGGSTRTHTRTHTHTHTYIARRSHIVLKKWRGRSGGGHSPTTERERRNNGDSEEEGLLRDGRGWVWWGRS